MEKGFQKISKKFFRGELRALWRSGLGLGGWCRKPSLTVGLLPRPSSLAGQPENPENSRYNSLGLGDAEQRGYAEIGDSISPKHDRRNYKWVVMPDKHFQTPANRRSNSCTQPQRKHIRRGQTGSSDPPI